MHGFQPTNEAMRAKSLPSTASETLIVVSAAHRLYDPCGLRNGGRMSAAPSTQALAMDVDVQVACRGISATHETHAAMRVMPSTMASGQAGDAAAATAAVANAPIPQLDVAMLRRELRDAGAQLP
jgi:hypothetical protein